MKEKEQEKDIRCGVCNKKLAQGRIISIQIKCPRCKSMNSLRDMSPQPESHRASKTEVKDTHECL